MRLSRILMCLLMAGSLSAGLSHADTRKNSASAVQPVSLLDSKWTFSLPAGYVQGEMPEIDATAKAQGVSGALYTQQTEKRVVIVTQSPIPLEVDAADNDTAVLDGMASGTQKQMGQSYQDYKANGAKTVVLKSGLGVRQLDASATMSGAPILSSTLLAASGKHSAVINVLSSAKDPKGHEAAVKRILGQ